MGRPVRRHRPAPWSPACCFPAQGFSDPFAWAYVRLGILQYRPELAHLLMGARWRVLLTSAVSTPAVNPHAVFFAHCERLRSPVTAGDGEGVPLRSGRGRVVVQLALGGSIELSSLSTS